MSDDGPYDDPNRVGGQLHGLVPGQNPLSGPPSSTLPGGAGAPQHPVSPPAAQPHNPGQPVSPGATQWGPGAVPASAGQPHAPQPVPQSPPHSAVAPLHSPHAPPANPNAMPLPQARAGAPTSSGTSFSDGLARAFKLRVDPASLREPEMAQLAACNPPITSRSVQAFLVWRRSLLLIVSVLLAPLAILKVVEGVQGINSLNKAAEQTPALEDMASTLTALGVLDMAVFVGFAIYAWILLGSWTNWHKQRKRLLRAWLVFFLVPFTVALYPVRSALESAGIPTQQALMLGIVVALQVVLTMAPKAISLMPGLMRATIATKLLFPGAGGLGWLMVVVAPLYAIFLLVILIVPYQLSGNPAFILGVAAIIVGQYWMLRAGSRLARPMSLDEVQAAVSKARVGYLVCNVVAGVLIVAAFAELIKLMDISALSVINALAAMALNVLLLTLIGTDVLVAGLERAQSASSDERSIEIAEVFGLSLSDFVRECGHPPDQGEGGAP